MGIHYFIGKRTKNARGERFELLLVRATDWWDDQLNARCAMSEKCHPGITMHELSFGGGFVGFLFAAGSALIFVLGFPTLWYFVAFAAALGIGIAIFLKLTSRRSSEHNRPLSILHAPGETKAPPSQEPKNGRQPLQLLARPSQA
jgi:hypothetical protein